METEQNEGDVLYEKFLHRLRTMLAVGTEEGFVELIPYADIADVLFIPPWSYEVRCLVTRTDGSEAIYRLFQQSIEYAVTLGHPWAKLLLDATEADYRAFAEQCKPGVKCDELEGGKR